MNRNFETHFKLDDQILTFGSLKRLLSLKLQSRSTNRNTTTHQAQDIRKANSCADGHEKYNFDTTTASMLKLSFDSKSYGVKKSCA